MTRSLSLQALLRAKENLEIVQAKMSADDYKIEYIVEVS